jgi:hypothetical protein
MFGGLGQSKSSETIRGTNSDGQKVTASFGVDGTRSEGHTYLSDGWKNDSSFWGSSGNKGHDHYDGKGGATGRGNYTGYGS